MGTTKYLGLCYVTLTAVKCASVAAKAGGHPVLWPGSVVAYQRRMCKVAERDYMLDSGKPESPKILAAENRGIS